MQKKKELVVKATDFSLIAKQLYKIGLDEILCKDVPEHERQMIIIEAHGGATSGQYAGKATV